MVTFPTAHRAQWEHARMVRALAKVAVAARVGALEMVALEEAVLQEAVLEPAVWLVLAARPKQVAQVAAEETT